MDINSVNIIGRAVKDAEFKSTTSGKEVATVSIAVNGYNDEVSYFDIVMWGNTAGVARDYIKKSKQIAVQGRLQQRKWQDKDGNNRYSVEIVANQVKLLGGNEAPQKDVVPVDVPDEAIDLSSIPF